MFSHWVLIHARLDPKSSSFDSVNTTPPYLYTFHKVGLAWPENVVLGVF